MDLTENTVPKDAEIIADETNKSEQKIVSQTTTANADDIHASKNTKDGELNPAPVAAVELHTPIITEEIPIISLTDGEDSSPTRPQQVVKKRRSVGAGSEEFRSVKRRKIKVAGAPKRPLTGYVRYMNDRREILRKQYPTKTAIEHTKMIGEEWQQLSDEVRAPYMQAADLDKRRYTHELQNFFKTHPDVLACELAKEKERKNNANNNSNNATSTDAGSKTVLKEKQQTNGNAKIIKETAKEKPHASGEQDQNTVAAPSPTSFTAPQKLKRTPTPVNNSSAVATNTLVAPVPGEIPIFTNEFLEHNKQYDMELRTLRKSKADLEQQNAVLEKHVENMKFGVEKLANENDELQEKNRLLQIYLDKLKQKLAHALAGLAIPTEPNGATVENIDKYMNDLYKMVTSNTHGPASLNKARDIIRKLDLHIQL